MLKREEMTKEMTYFKYDFSGAGNLCEIRSKRENEYLNFDIFAIIGYNFMPFASDDFNGYFFSINGSSIFIEFKSEEEITSFVNILAVQQQKVRTDQARIREQHKVSDRLKI